MSFLAALAVERKNLLRNRVASSQKRCAVPCPTDEQQEELAEVRLKRVILHHEQYQS